MRTACRAACPPTAAGCWSAAFPARWVGRMCMDQLLADVTQVPDAAPGDAVTLLGADGGEVIPATELADACGTITNELLSRLGARLPVIVRP